MRIRTVILYGCLLLAAAWGSRVSGQPPHTFTRYTSEDGLLQKTIQCTLQDHKGVMWFATWDGLYKFDGYDFTNYKAHPGDTVRLGNNRLGYIGEDRYGYIWIHNYDHLVYRFDPEKEQFASIPCGGRTARTIQLLPQGDVWITTDDDRLVRVTTHPRTHEPSATDFFRHHGLEAPGHIEKVWQGEEGTQWILTGSGVWSLGTDGQPRKRFGDASYDVCAAADGTLWFAAEGGRLRTWTPRDGQSGIIHLPTSSSLRFVRLLGGKRLFVGTASDGFFLYDIATGEHRHYTGRTTASRLCDDRIRDVYVDAHGEVWMRLAVAGITHFDPLTETLEHFLLRDKEGRNITDGRMEINVLEDVNGLTWVHPAGGGFAYYDRASHKLVPFHNPDLQEGWSAANRVTSVFSDRQGNLWLASYGNGLEKVSFNTRQFHLLIPHPEAPESAGNSTRAVYQDRDGNIWVGGRDRVIRLYDAQLNYLGGLTAQGTVRPGATDRLGIAYCFLQDSSGTVWIGTKGDGLLAVVPQEGRQTGAGFRFTLERYMAPNPGTDSGEGLSGNEVYSLYEDRNGRLWMATFDGGVNFLDLREERGRRRFVHARTGLDHYPIGTCYRTRFVTGDADGRIWIASTAGLLMCDTPDSAPEAMRFHHFQRIPGDARSLSNNDVHYIFFSRERGDMYAATFGGGLNKLVSLEKGEARFRSYTMQDGLASDILLSVQEDADGQLWMAAEDAVCRLDPATGEATNYPGRFFPQQFNFSEGASLHTQDGRLMFCTAGKGVLWFTPDSIRCSDYVPPILFTRFRAKEDEQGEANRYGQTVDNLQSIRLPHRQNGFSIEFAALDMKYPAGISYAYRLVGFEKNWNEIGNRRTATYTNLPWGEYTLQVRSTNSDGVWVENTRELAITVLPSFWETPWAYLLYVVAVLLVIAAASWTLFTIYRLKHKVSVEQEIADIKLRFFTNISHELRTPLTLITGPVEQILQNGRLEETERNLLTLVKRNTSRMLHLVNQILDLRKVQSGRMKLRVQQIDLVPFIRHIMENFYQLADEHQTDFRLETDVKSLAVWADADKLEKVLFNLISNAFKYTPEGKGIKVVVHGEEHEAVITVEDQGIGISENSQKTLFVRFEALADRTLFDNSSTGIGLSLAKELVEAHHGSIGLASRPGEGSRFTIRLPKGKEHYGADTEFILSDSVMTDISRTYDRNTALTVLDQAADDTSADRERETLLIVEDNPELRFFLHGIFADSFHVIEAEDGLEGLEKGKRLLPDIIVSDVMMPGMDGMAMMAALHEEMATSHIPIVLLTAKSNIESRIEGVGADDYITKPFSATYLKARVIALLEKRKKLQALYRATLMPVATETGALGDGTAALPDGCVSPASPSSASSGTASGEVCPDSVPVLSPNDRRFMDTLLAFVEKHIDNGDLLVEDMAREVNMSRSVFFKKLKCVTGLSPIEFLKDMRIRHAARLIKRNEYSMQQIAYMAGFNDSHYFSKCFKLQFGMTPTEYKERKLGKNG